MHNESDANGEEKDSNIVFNGEEKESVVEQQKKLIRNEHNRLYKRVYKAYKNHSTYLNKNIILLCAFSCINTPIAFQ